MNAFGKTVLYFTLLAFLVSINACTMSQYTAHTPEEIFSKNSDVDLDEDYTLDSISLKNKKTLKTRNYVTQYIENQKEKYLVYYYPKSLFIDSALMVEKNSKVLLYKKPISDTLNFKAIDSLHFTRKKFDSSYLVLGGVLVGSIVLVIIGFFVYSKPKNRTN